jgi:hypothetical protein
MSLRGRVAAVLVGLLCSLGAAGAAPAEEAYVPYSGIIRGTEGAERVELRVANASSGPMACVASLAHWYSERLGEAAAGAMLGVVLWHDPETGVLNLMNATDDRMPVEAIWCGRAGAVHATRDRIALPFAAGPAPEAIARVCRDGADGRLACERAGG